MTHKHTPAPWIIDDVPFNDGSVAIDAPEAEEGIGRVYCHSKFKRGDGHLSKCKTREANAHLIATAPELLAELERILNNHRTDGASDSFGQVVLSRAREARIEDLIAKARGEND